MLPYLPPTVKSNHQHNDPKATHPKWLQYNDLCIFCPWVPGESYTRNSPVKSDWPESLATRCFREFSPKFPGEHIISY